MLSIIPKIIPKRALIICSGIMSILYPSFGESKSPQAHGLQGLEEIEQSEFHSVFHNIYMALYPSLAIPHPNWPKGANDD